MGKKAVQNYLNRELDDWDWLKELSRDEVSNEIKHYFPNFNPDIAFAHQLPCVLAGILNSEFNFFLDMGLGKTFVILNLIKYWRRKYFKKNKAIVLVPNEINVYTWLDEIKKFTSFKGVPVVGSTKKKVEILNSEGHIFICNYLGFLHIFTKRVKGKGRGKDKSVIDNEKVKTILKDYRFLICDEIHRLGNSQALTTKLADTITCPVRYGLTGTPFGKSPERLWSEFKVIDNGDTLGFDERMFKDAYFTKSFNYFGGLDYHFKSRLSDHLHQTIKHKSLGYTTDECFDLPSLNEYTIEIPMNKEARVYYNQSHDQLVASLKEGETAIGNSFVRLRSICAGYLYFRNELGQKTKSDLITNPKLDYLIEMLNDVEGKVLVFNEYTLTGDIIEARFKKEKVKYKRLYGGTKNKQQVKQDFETGDYKVLLLNSETGGTGSNFQYCQYSIFFESTVKPDTKKQCIKRIHRIGQTEKTFIYNLVMRNTLEEDILESIDRGENLYQSIIKGKRKLKKCQSKG